MVYGFKQAIKSFIESLEASQRHIIEIRQELKRAKTKDDLRQLARDIEVLEGRIYHV